MTTKVFTGQQHGKMRKTLQLLDERIGRKQLAKALGLATQTVSNLSQRQSFSRRIAEALAELTGLTVEQLIAGEAPRRCPTCGQNEDHHDGPAVGVLQSRAELTKKVAAETQVKTVAVVAEWLNVQAAGMEEALGGDSNPPLTERNKALMMGATVWREAATMLTTEWSKIAARMTIKAKPGMDSGSGKQTARSLALR